MSVEYVSPIDRSVLVKREKEYEDKKKNIFQVENNIPNFVYPKELPESDVFSLNLYKKNADNYDKYLPLTFETFKVSEDNERQKMIDALQLKPNHKVLEIGSGTGRDSLKIASQMDESGELFLSDISYDMFKYTVKKFQNNQKIKPQTKLFLANAYNLPFEDKVFDRVFHFGGINDFGDIKKTFSEMARVCKCGGRVVVGDENMPIWLRNTEFGKVLMNSNPSYKDLIPFDSLPIEARNVKVEWIIGGVFYFISFEVGEGEPFADLDFEIPGVRGGTHRTRYYGHLEGVSPETVNLVKKAREKSSVSMHKWLDSRLREIAKKELEE